jgi:hypothetical protein
MVPSLITTLPVLTKCRKHLHQNLYTNCSINIPEFMGPGPSHNSHDANLYLPYSPTILQNEENQSQSQPKNNQEPSRNPNSTPRSGTKPNYHNTPPTSPGEGTFCMYKEEHIADGINQCKQSLIGKILLAQKPILKSVLHNTLTGMWGNPQGMVITEIEGGLFLISMDLDKDLQRAIKGNPWVIRNSWFLVQPWDRQINPQSIDFLHMPIWIQLWGLPIHCKTIAMGKHLGSQLGKVEESALYDYPQKARIVKIKVWIHIEDPIRPGMFIGNTKDGITWIDFRYENMPMFCFGCGLVGHNEDQCENETPTDGEVNTRGPWLRSNVFGRRINEKRDKRFNSDPLQSASGGQFCSIPKAMMEMLAKMKLEEENEEKNQGNASAQSTAEGKGKTTKTHSAHHQLHTPTIAKRKFQKIQHATQAYSIASTSAHTQNSMVSLENKANQGQ